ncbi:uncharacterized protein LOC135263731 [Anguilla rostrata]|uniref:uncharacterized protein LOC135263731 n=1 Tax=Anguilla rostrata TaxID=7938 RepID=UPI0030CFD527
MSDPLRTNRASLRAAERKWRKSMAQSDLSAYQSILATFSTAVTSAKINYYQTKIHKSASNPHQLFSIFSSLLSTPSPPQSSLAADDFAVFFDQKIADIRSSFTSTTTLPHSPISVPSPCFSTFSPLTDSDVSQLLLSHRPTTCALDSIPSSLLQTITPDILPFVTSLVNSSLSSGCFPSSFKLAHITPLLKKPTLDPSVIQNYRPVSLLPFLSKTIERAASNQLSSFLLLNNLLDPHQSGFRPGHSTETALLSVSARISACLRDIQSWMDNHHLKLNPGKTEMIFIPAPSSNLLDFSISLGDTVVSSSPTAKNLGVVMDNRLSLSQNITAVSRTCKVLPVQHPENPPLPHHLRNPAPGSSDGPVPPGLLQLAAGWSASIRHQTPAAHPECCSASGLQPPQTFPCHPPAH